jgi:hypothetical protein
MGEHHWKFLLHVINEIVKKVTKCPWTDCNNKGLKKRLTYITLFPLSLSFLFSPSHSISLSVPVSCYTNLFPMPVIRLRHSTLGTTTLDEKSI